MAEKQQRTLVDQVFKKIFDLLVRGEIPLGGVVNEAALAERFQVSRGPVREAVKQLQGRALVVKEPYLKARVVDLSVEDMIELAVFLKQRGYKPRQVQDFIPAPMDIATCMYHTGLDPMTMKSVDTVTRLRDRKVQRALMQFFKPENHALVREALISAGREDLIGKGKLCLIPN